ncbi:amidase family protein [Solirubrobacter phytolaccae]|uniref:Amidase family protein n=1 Tax=Solirubrobacter phytolaccae TaxID=1404360 RepID=A0A9X3N4K0_9ACTN|nr:amidase family protein [Solirubrobacter phytolaccae]MDA0179593.1 amidase family protein [Solirubrobacter phytolaccae]
MACALVGLLLVAVPAKAAAPALDLERLTVSELQTKMAAGQLTSVQLTRAYVDRIAAVNARGPGLNAVRLVNPRALQDASLLDLERATGKLRGPLHGVPVLVKDNLDVAGLPTTAGTVALQNSIPSRDSTVVAKLRAAGAVILGKTNLSEFANFMTSGMPNGYSSLGGQVLNPYDLDLGTSGSSSGSGSAAAAGLAAITIGTETSGSIVSPSAQQGIVGLRPTVGLVSRAGILPISATQDTAGPMTRTVADAAAELQAIAGSDPEDPATTGAPAVPDYLSGLKADALAGKRIGVITNTNAQYVAAVAAVQALGATTVTVASPTAAGTGDILTPEFKRDLNAYLGRLPASAPMKSLADIIAFNNLHADETLKFGQSQLEASERTDLNDPAQNAAYVTARDTGRASARAAIDAALTSNSLDAILTPSGTLTGLGARAGYPQIVVPAGYNAAGRAPVGVAFNGTAFSEAALLAFAYAYEQATKLRRVPSEINPASWRCYAGAPRSCPPGREVATGVTLDFPLETATVADLQQRMTAGTLSATQLTKAYLQRIALTNTEGPSINAVRLINPKALQEAAKADAERAAGTVRGPLHGIPVLVKDNLDVAGLPTTAGSVALENSIPATDSPVVAKLRAAGAILLGKLNLSEFANFLTNGMPSGYSSLGGQVLNPYNADITPSGSSSGSGAAAAAGLAAITIGTETSGSIVSPSAAQGIVGLRPTIGLVSRTGILPISATQDTAGPMTRTVADAAAELGAIAGKDAQDPATDAAPATVPDYLGALKADALAGKRIGVITNTNAQYVAAIAAVQALGATTVTVASPTAAGTGDILTPEFKRDLNAYLSRLPASAPMKSLADIIDFNEDHEGEALKFGQSQLLASQATDLTDPAQNAAYVTARDTGRASARAAIDNVLTANQLDALMTPSGTLTGLGARAGYPQLVVPAGYASATRDPVGIAFNGTAFSEAALLAFGYAYEQATKLRKPPSETNPSLWRCVPGNAYAVSTRACAPSTPANADAVSTIVSGTVPATLTLTLGPPATFPTFAPGVERTYTAATWADVISTAGEATLTTSEPGYLTNGAFRLPRPLQVQLTPPAFTAPVSHGTVDILFRQPIGATDALRTGTYSRTLTFTLSTTTP